MSREDKAKRFALIAAWLASLVGALLLGRSSVPVATREEEKKKTERVEVEVESKQATATIAALRQQVAELKQRILRRVVTIRRPDGTVIRRRLNDIRSEATTRTQEKADVTTKEETQKAAVVSQQETVTRSKTEERDDPNLKVGLLVGTNVTKLLPSPSLTVGAQAAGRVGPLWMGAYGLSDGNVGLSLSVEWW